MLTEPVVAGIVILSVPGFQKQQRYKSDKLALEPISRFVAHSSRMFIGNATVQFLETKFPFRHHGDWGSTLLSLLLTAHSARSPTNLVSCLLRL